MLRFLVLLLILIGAAAIQTALSDLASIGPARPDLMIAAAVYLALAFDAREVFIALWGLGILRDACCALPMGVHGLVFLGIALLGNRVRQVTPPGSPVVLGFMAAMAAVLCETIGAFVLSALYHAPVPGGLVFSTLLSGCYTAALAVILPRFLYHPCRWVGMGRLSSPL